MCDHYNLHKQFQNHGIQELTTQEIIDILDYIKNIGTDSVILSGGEPLIHPDFDKILEYGKNLKLCIGLLTNGIKFGGKPLTVQDARRIINSVSWIQVSLDSKVKSFIRKISSDLEIGQIIFGDHPYSLKVQWYD